MSENFMRNIVLVVVVIAVLGFFTLIISNDFAKKGDLGEFCDGKLIIGRNQGTNYCDGKPFMCQTNNFWGYNYECDYIDCSCSSCEVN